MRGAARFATAFRSRALESADEEALLRIDTPPVGAAELARDDATDDTVIDERPEDMADCGEPLAELLPPVDRTEADGDAVNPNAPPAVLSEGTTGEGERDAPFRCAAGEAEPGRGEGERPPRSFGAEAGRPAPLARAAAAAAAALAVPGLKP